MIRRLKNGGASGMLNSTRASSIKDFTVEIQVHAELNHTKYKYMYMYMFTNIKTRHVDVDAHIPVSFKPVEVSILSSFFSASVKPSLSATAVSHCSRYLRKSVSSH